MSSILFNVEQGIGMITLNRPDKLNSLNRDLSLQFLQRLDECAADKAIRCIYITGAGKGFSAGTDLEEFVNPNGSSIREVLGKRYNPIVMRIRNIPKPIVAAVNGAAAGAGASIAFACDVVVATQSAYFLQAFSKIGLIPDTGGTYTLPRLIGWQKASALMMLAEKVPASEALAMGMVYKVFSDESFAEESKKIALTLANMPTKGLGNTKYLLNQSLTNSLENQLSLEIEFQEKSAATADSKEGINAFLEKRKPVFKGE